MQCENCKKELAAEGWELIRIGGSSGRFIEKLSDIVRTSEHVFCSEKCRLEWQAGQRRMKQGY
jgi:Holliday junction resolvase